MKAWQPTSLLLIADRLARSLRALEAEAPGEGADMGAGADAATRLRFERVIPAPIGLSAYVVARFRYRGAFGRCAA